MTFLHKKLEKEILPCIFEKFFPEYDIWSIIQSKYSYHMCHNHGDSIYSLAYYVKIPKDNLLLD